MSNSSSFLYAVQLVLSKESLWVQNGQRVDNKKAGLQEVVERETHRWEEMKGRMKNVDITQVERRSRRGCRAGKLVMNHRRPGPDQGSREPDLLQCTRLGPSTKLHEPIAYMAMHTSLTDVH
jgi:hypothetical protein